MTSYVVPDETPGGWDDRTAGDGDFVTDVFPQMRTVVVECDDSARHRLAMQLGQSVFDYDTVASFAAELGPTPTVVVFGPSFAAPSLLHDAVQVIRDRPEVGAILVADELTTDLFQQAIRSGIRDVLAAPVDTAQLQEACRRVADSVGSVARSIGVVGADPGGDDDEGRVITVFSPKGGAGKSVMATNLAVSLAQRSERPVVLVDCDLQFGDVAVMLKLAPQHTMVDAVGALERLDAAFVANLLMDHKPSGLKVLAAPLEPAYADQITADQVRAIIGVLRRSHAYVVVDTPSYFDDKVLTLLEECDEAVLVAGMDIPNIKNVKLGLQTMRMLNTPLSKVHLVLNRANTKVKLDIGEVERTLQIKAEIQVPSDIVVPVSVNKGLPVVLDAPRSGVAKALESLADLFAPAPASKKRWR